MTLPSTGAISMAMLRAEFGGAAGTPLHSYYRGGAYVPNTAANAAIPTAPPITLHDFRGASASTALSVSLSPPTITRLAAPGNVTTAVCTATATGGAGPRTYAWTRLSGATQITAVNPSSSATAFAATITASSNYTAVFRCTVTDSTGSASANVTVNIASTV